MPKKNYRKALKQNIALCESLEILIAGALGIPVDDVLCCTMTEDSINNHTCTSFTVKIDRSIEDLSNKRKD